MIDPKAEKVLRLEEVPRIKWLPKCKKRPLAFSTIYRWATRGVRGGVKLETLRIGSALHTSEEALERFIQRCSGEAPMETPQTASDDATESRLKALGAI